MHKGHPKIVVFSMATVFTVMLAVAGALAQSTTGAVSSALSDTAEKGKAAASEAADKTLNFLKGASTGTPADILSWINEVNETEILFG